MRKLVPLRDSVVCRKICGGKRTVIKNGISVKKTDIDIYEIIQMPKVKTNNDFQFGVGDAVISNSTGDEIEINPGETVYLFKIENIMCNVVIGDAP